jgi:hypothetical protein
MKIKRAHKLTFYTKPGRKIRMLFSHEPCKVHILGVVDTCGPWRMVAYKYYSSRQKGWLYKVDSDSRLQFYHDQYLKTL